MKDNLEIIGLSALSFFILLMVWSFVWGNFDVFYWDPFSRGFLAFIWVIATLSIIKYYE